MGNHLTALDTIRDLDKGGLLQRLCDNMPQPAAMAIVAPNEQDEPLYVCDSKAWRERYGIEGDLTGRNHYVIFPGLPIEWKAEHVAAFRNGTVFRQEDGFWFHNANTGNDMCLTYVVWPLVKRGDRWTVVFMSFDITREMRAIEKMERAAYTDALTGIPNRRAGMEALEGLMQQVSESQCRAVPCRFAVLFIDLDKFKPVNDRLGHRVGDVVLRTVAERARGCMSNSDHFSRLGGDEFMAVIRHVDQSEAEALAQRIVSAIEQPIEVAEQQIDLSASIGIIMHDIAHAMRSREIIACADMAMYQAKRSGDQWRVFTSEMQYRWRQESELVDQLPGAISREFELYYQPIYSTATGEVIAFEALSRWLHPELGTLPPGKFLPLITKAGQHDALCEWVLRTSIGQSVRWKRIKPDIQIACNCEMEQIRSGFAHDVITRAYQELAAENGIKIELVERNLSALSDQVSLLISKSVRLLIDDFGTNQANFYEVLKLREKTDLLEVKCDRSLIQDITHSEIMREGVRGIIQFAHQRLRCGIIMEGVETREQMDFLKEAGCDGVQGYYLGYPVPADEAERLIRRKPVGNHH